MPKKLQSVTFTKCHQYVKLITKRKAQGSQEIVSAWVLSKNMTRIPPLQRAMLVSGGMNRQLTRVQPPMWRTGTSSLVLITLLCCDILV